MCFVSAQPFRLKSVGYIKMKKSRDQLLLGLRPALALAKASSAEEQFQNEVLRPLLKFQNELLLELARNYIGKRHKAFNALKISAQVTLLKRASKQDPELRNILVYSVASLLTLPELPFYESHRAELNRRIVNMGLQRIIDQVDRLY